MFLNLFRVISIMPIPMNRFVIQNITLPISRGKDPIAENPSALRRRSCLVVASKMERKLVYTYLPILTKASMMLELVIFKYHA